MEAARLKEEFERKEREAVAKALALKKKQGANATVDEEKPFPRSHSKPAASKDDDLEEDDFVPPPVSGPPPSWSDDDGDNEVFEE